jgi:hypothetical protein
MIETDILIYPIWRHINISYVLTLGWLLKCFNNKISRRDLLIVSSSRRFTSCLIATRCWFFIFTASLFKIISYYSIVHKARTSGWHNKQIRLKLDLKVMDNYLWYYIILLDFDLLEANIISRKLKENYWM